MQSFRRIGSKLWKIGAIQNLYPIVVYGATSDSDSKNPGPMIFLSANQLLPALKIVVLSVVVDFVTEVRDKIIPEVV